ncbi:MAG: E3 binding domain-containing protein, partial [Chloroflexota bacterium]
YDDTTFALLIPDMCGPEAKVYVEELHLRLGSVPLALDQYNARKSGFRGVASVVELCDQDADAEELLDEALAGLQEAERGTYGRVALRTTPVHEHEGHSNGHVQPELANGGSPEAASPPAGKQPEQAQPEQVQPEQAQPEQVQPEQAQPEQVQPEQTQPEQVQPEHKVSLTRAALKLAQQYGIDPDTIQGSGKDGRILKSDVKQLIKDKPELELSPQS